VPLLGPDATSIVAVVGAGLGLVGVGVAGLAHTRLTAMRRSYARLLGGTKEADIVTVVGQHVRAVEGLQGTVRALQGDVVGLREDLGTALRHVAVVRYDAFGDMGGRLSFSAALLDDAGDGLVLTSINGRSEARSYAKGIRAGGSEIEMSPEEREAVGHAMKQVSAARGGRPLVDVRDR
jgi:hypothetical protein